MRANTNITLKDKMQIELSDFKGVDFSSSPLRVQQNRASNMKNFINEYGINKKRNGWNELFKIRNADGSAAKINGIYQYVNNDYKMLLVHAGKRFYEVKYNEATKKYITKDITESSTYSASLVDVSILLDNRSQVFFNNSKAYITGCGDYLVYGSWDNGLTYELRRVLDNEDTYIPTTTISIDNDDVKDGTRSTLDDINLLSSRRKNQLLGVDNASATWTVDSGEIDQDSDVIITLETLDGTTAVTKDITNLGATDKTKLYHNTTEVGKINYLTGQITLNINTKPQIEGRDNIYITFKHAINSYADRITKCNFGILFGVGGNTDRLFLSGNSNYPNIDFHSEMDDYTYFGDLNTSSMGSNSVAVMGYGRLSDSTLVIYKEDSGQEASIFYRTGQYSEQYDESGNLQSIRAVFPTTAGSIGEGVVSRFATCNFAGDNIILSKNGVFGIVLANNVATAERYTRERSRYINEKLKQHADLSEAVGIVYKNRYYLSIDNVCYVADARFKSTAEGDMEDTYNYEWWYWDNIPARVWANIENNLYFGTADGQVCVFDDTFIDKTYTATESGDLMIDVDRNVIVFNENIGFELAENDEITITTNGVYQLLIEQSRVEDNKVYVSEEEIVSLYDGIEVYVDNVGSSGLSLNTKYTLINVDRGLCCFNLTDENGEIVEVYKNGFRICKHISQTKLYVTDIVKTTFKIKDYLTSEPLTLASYNNTIPLNPLASFVIKRNVVAEWYTPIFDFGTNQLSKTLLKLTISTEPIVNGAVVFGYETKSAEKNINAKGVSVFSFEDMNFENFSFDTGFASSYTIKVKERNFNFIMFRFYSNNEHDCAINTFTALYKINKTNKGVQ